MFLLVAGGTPLAAQAQQAIALTGRVQSPTGAPVEFATLTLHRAVDSTVVKSEFSDAQGAFRFEVGAAGRYLVSAAQVGYERYWSAPVALPADGLELPPIALRPSAATSLQEVRVVGRKPQFERLADRTVVNVDGSPLAAGNTTLDVLSRAPGVTVAGDNLALRGKQGLLVIIDGKRQPLTGAELADYLRALPAEQVRSIELITNPPASYDAQGGAGIIAINLKKDQRQGTNGSANVAYGRGYHGRFTTGLSVNYQRNKVNLFGSYAYSDRTRQLPLTAHRDFAQGGQPLGTSDLDSHNRLRAQAHTWRAGLDYTLSKRTVIGVTASGLAREAHNAGANDTRFYGPDGGLTGVTRVQSFRDVTTPNAAANLNLRHVLANSSASGEVSGDVSYADYRTTRHQGLTTVPEGTAPAPSTLLGHQTGRLIIQSAQVDYRQPLAHGRQLELGVKASAVRADNDAVFTRTAGGQTAVDPTLTNRFLYDETIGAAYASVAQTWPKTKLQVGLRGEQTWASGRQDVGHEGFDRRYFQLFPSGSLTRTLSDKHELAVALSRRIDRPGYGALNPFRVYVDATTYSAGNPDLRPQTSYNLELTHTFQQQFSTSLSYSTTRHPLVDAVQPESATSRLIVQRPVNLTTQQYYALTLTAPWEPRKGCNLYNTLVAYYSRYVGELAGTTLHQGRPAFSLSTEGTVALPKDWLLEANASYNSREQLGFIDHWAYGQLSLGAQKSVWAGKGTLKISVSDVLFTDVTRGRSTYANYQERFRERSDSRAATLSFAYRFGNEQVAPARRRTDGAADEKRRAGQ
ncbi:TonB-dependent receptor [Hymenobacter sp. CRA2]|uniref:TonB-dependent receptor n=1 Tax=Hymenobacter sp. CRA2 TaxID=1955620 RepID=UPI00098FA382|nr:TonB-dependent receptor [Hymenobacter sp. CRA2]OON70886.1 TonB-dependent receptor [Hymenobacter sp. CRA2]